MTAQLLTDWAVRIYDFEQDGRSRRAYNIVINHNSQSFCCLLKTHRCLIGVASSHLPSEVLIRPIRNSRDLYFKAMVRAFPSNVGIYVLFK